MNGKTFRSATAERKFVDKCRFIAEGRSDRSPVVCEIAQRYLALRDSTQSDVWEGAPDWSDQVNLTFVKQDGSFTKFVGKTYTRDSLEARPEGM